MINKQIKQARNKTRWESGLVARISSKMRLSTIKINKRITKCSAIKCAVYKNKHLFQECPLSDFLQLWFWHYWFWWCTKSVVVHLMNSPLQHGKSSRTQRGTQLCQLLKWKKKKERKTFAQLKHNDLLKLDQITSDLLPDCWRLALSLQSTDLSQFFSCC